jgi:hypothetical protein
MFPRGRATPLLLALAVGLAACDGSDPVGNSNPPAQPAPPTVAVQGDALVVSWNAVTGATAYDVQRQEAGASFSTIASDVSGTSHTDSDVTPGTTYGYRVIAKNTDGSSNPSDPALGMVDEDQPAEAVLAGPIDDTRTLSADTVYTITGTVTVEDGGRLNIPAGTLLLGSVQVAPSAIMVRQGGQLYSEGTAENPVVFTSGAPEGSRARGDWGGVVLNGRSLCNFPAGECIGEGASGPYGGDVLDDNSGRIVYTRIEFAGYEVSFGNELNALTLNGVGSGTELHHIQAHYGSDDGFEFFGGTVDLKYALATGISDDSFDYSTGWQGRGQFWISQHDPDDADNGWEVDGNEDDSDAEPFTDPLIYNATLVGKGENGAGGTAGESTRGMLQRLGAAGEVHNAIIMGFGTSGFDVDNPQTAGRFMIANSIIFSNAVDFDTDDDGIDEEAIWNTAAWANRNEDPGLADPYNRDAYDFRPTAGSAATSGFAAPPTDDFFDDVDFLGGVSPDGTPWYEGWTTAVKN